jgi:hypothetical protein
MWRRIRSLRRHGGDRFGRRGIQGLGRNSTIYRRVFLDGVVGLAARSGLAGPVFSIALAPVGGFMPGSVALGFTAATTLFPAISPGFEVAAVASPGVGGLTVAGDPGAGRLGAVGALAAGVGAAVAWLVSMRLAVTPGGTSAARCRRAYRSVPGCRRSGRPTDPGFVGCFPPLASSASD